MCAHSCSIKDSLNLQALKFKVTIKNSSICKDALSKLHANLSARQFEKKK